MRASRRLPGIRFEAQPRPATNVLPRMDIALFAGFAASGPLHVPVPVEDPAQFAAIFGEDCVVARDPRNGGPRYAYLAPAVRAFFRNGGRRCWILRLAGGGAALNRFRVPSLEVFDPISDQTTPAFAEARSEGSWSDALRVSTNLVRHGIRLKAWNDDDDDAVRLEIEVSAAGEVVPGDLLRLRFDALSFFVFADSVKRIDRAVVEVTSKRHHRQGESPLSPPPTASLPDAPIAERLLFDLNVRVEGSPPIRIKSLGFAPEHPRYWGALPDDKALYRQLAESLDASAFRPRTDWPDVWTAALTPRFPLAATSVQALFLPIDMPAQPLPKDETTAEPQALSTLERDGLVPFDRTLFLDEDLADTGLRDLIGEADFLRYQAEPPRELRGIHAGLSVDEATILCVPDAIHCGWERGDGSLLVSTAAPAPPPDPRLGEFLDCALLEPVDVPELHCTAPVAGTFTLTWTPLAGTNDEIEEATRDDFSDADVIDRSSNRGTLARSRDVEGDYHYRLRRHAGARVSAYSNAVAVQVSAGAGWTALDEGPSATLLDVQTAMLRMCAGRGDLMALLTLPLATREDAAIEYAAALQSAVEAPALSYGALVHPWLTGREENDVETLRTNPPDGATAGVMAARSIARGAWVAPANEPLRGVVALVPPIDASRHQSLQDAQINIVRQEPSGFVCLDSDTLSGDDDVRPINVRRLLILVRRAALDLGTAYVFEPNDGALRRAVKRALEALLETMFRRGAFAGTISRAGFQVTTDDTVNTRNDQDNGRFLAEVRVAPSLPLSFLTIRLQQRGDRTVAQEVR
jgi:phage tail sheath protein FI